MQKDGSKFRKQLRETEHQKIVDLLTAGKGEWKGTKLNPFRSIAKADLIEEAKVRFYFISSVLRPSKHLSTVGREEAILFYALLKGYKIYVGKMIENSILSYFEGKCRGMIPHPTTITSLCIQGGVKKEWGIEETYPRASPLTLTGITKGLKNRGKGREKETEAKKKKEKNEGCTEIEQWESQDPMQPEVKRNQDPIRNTLPKQRQNHNEQAECSRQDCSNGELMGMLMSM